ncbi:Paraquat-inducible protein A [Seminavis robusta]|uniref:Paraquat-inducible protein A n=1 Tax=Seminavis robusta TaxID=568900 RepID=A0A9N8H9G8_9STRA|nr:Paraquat-inducible protein A [Seminavis robusta]|eukprot:Sro191_g082110.1 Paraquat-inducible protein A (1731) ;mRNA; r:14603-20052
MKPRIPQQQHRPHAAISSWSLLLTLLLCSAGPAQPSHDVSAADDDSLQEQQPFADDDNLFVDTTPVYYRQAVDFRDLFLPPDQALALGGTGLAPYGDMIYTNVWPAVNAPMEEGADPMENMVNTQVIEPITVNQSGIPGSILYPEELLNYQFDLSTWLGDAHIKVSNIRVHNLNTFIPIVLLHPTTEAHVLSNVFQMGPNLTASNTPVQDIEEAPHVIIRLDVHIDGISTPLSSHDIVDIHLKIPSSHFLMDLVVLIDAMKLLNMPLGDVMNPFCWINTLLHTLDPYDPEHHPVYLQFFQSSLAWILLDVQCIDCSPNMETFVPRLMTSIRDSTDHYMDVLTKSIGGFIEDAAWNFGDLIDLTRTIQEASKFCPHHPDYIPNNETDQFVIYPNEDSITPTLSRSSLESVLALGMLTVESVTVVAAQKYLDELQHNPINATTAAVLHTTLYSQNATFLNFTEIDDTLGLLRDVLTPAFLNDVARGIVDPNTSAVALPLPTDTTFDTGLGHQVTVEQVQVQGLDTVQNLTFLKVVGPYELELELGLERLAGEIQLSFMTTPEYPGTPMMEPEHMTVFYNFTDVHIHLRLFMQVDVEELGNLQMWTLLQGPEFFVPCILAAAKRTSIESLNVTLGTADPFQVKGYLSKDLAAMVNGVGEDLFRDYGQDIVDAVPIFFQTTARRLANELLYEQYLQLTENTTACVLTNTSHLNDFVDFRALFLGKGEKDYGNLFQQIYSALEAELFTPAGVKQINDLVGNITFEQSNITGALTFEENGVYAEGDIPLGNAVISGEVNLTNIALYNLDSLGMPFRLLYPNESYLLDSDITVGAGGKPLTLSADLKFKATDGNEMNIDNDVSFAIGFDTLTMLLRILLKILEKSFLTFPLKSMTNVYCWIDLLPPASPEILNSTNQNQSGIAIYDIIWNYTNATTDLECRCDDCCTSPELPDLFTELYSQGEDSFDQIEELVKRVLDGQAVQNVLGQILETAPAYCPHSDEYDPTVAGTTPNILDPGTPPGVEGEEGRDPNAFFFNLFFGGFGIMVLLCFITARLIIFDKNRKWKKSLSSEGKVLLCQLEERKLERDDYLDQTMESLFYTTFIPASVRYGVPIVMLLDIFLFSIAHTQISIIIGLDVYFAGDQFYIAEIFTFTFFDGLRNTFDNGGYEMAILLLIFGGIWPYVRCVLSIILWVVPPTWLSSDHRGRMFIWIDAMNKLTVRDIFKFLTIIAVIFIFVGGPYVWNQPGSVLYAVKIIAVPGPAIYCGISAMIVSRVSGVWILEYHNMAMRAARKEYHREHMNPASYGLMDLTEVPEIPEEEEEDEDSETDDEDEVETEISGGSLTDDDYSTVPTEIDLPGSRYIIVCGRRILLGTLVSVDLSSILELILQSGTTYEEAISTFGVYSMICAVLIKARLVLENALDYVAMSIFLLAGIVAVYFMFFLQFYRWIKAIRTQGWRQLFPLFFEKDPDVVKLPEYLRLFAHRYSTAWVVAFSIGVFQLGAVTIYAIHYFCSFLDTIYYQLEFIGLIQSTEGLCWESQMSQVHNLIVFISCFAYLIFCFMVQLTVQYRANVAEASRLIRELDEEGAFLEHLEGAMKGGKLKSVGPINSSIAESIRSRLSGSEMSDLQHLYDAAVKTEAEAEWVGPARPPSTFDISENKLDDDDSCLPTCSIRTNAPSVDGTEQSPATLDESDDEVVSNPGIDVDEIDVDDVDVDSMAFTVDNSVVVDNNTGEIEV